MFRSSTLITLVIKVFYLKVMFILESKLTHIKFILLFSHVLQYIYSFIHSIGKCRMWRFLAVLRSFFQSCLLYTLFFHPFPPTSLPSSLTSSCHLFLGLPSILFVSKFIRNTFFWEFYFLPFSVRAQTDVIYLTLLSLL